MIGANSLVNRDIPAGAKAFGSPARIVEWQYLSSIQTGQQVKINPGLRAVDGPKFCSAARSRQIRRQRGWSKSPTPVNQSSPLGHKLRPEQHVDAITRGVETVRRKKTV